MGFALYSGTEKCVSSAQDSALTQRRGYWELKPDRRGDQGGVASICMMKVLVINKDKARIWNPCVSKQAVLKNILDWVLVLEHCTQILQDFFFLANLFLFCPKIECYVSFTVLMWTFMAFPTIFLLFIYLQNVRNTLLIKYSLPPPFSFQWNNKRPVTTCVLQSSSFLPCFQQPLLSGSIKPPDSACKPKKTTAIHRKPLIISAKCGRRHF